LPVHFNHTLVYVKDKQESSTFLADILGLDAPTPYGPFLMVKLDNDVELGFLEVEQVFQQHHAFLVSEADFDVILDRIVARGLTYYADPGCTQPNEVNHDDGGRGLYWPDPSGHLLELITRHYGSG
jgi:catechol 2,3-dioxygenase-like lactoylglutathione lyase family enzyme